MNNKINLVYPELSYKLVGILYDVYNELGPGYQERYYQRGVKAALMNVKVGFKEQLHSEIIYKGQSIGEYYFDFLIEDKIILELKRNDRFFKRDIEQVIGYLKNKDLKLGILASFSNYGVKIKRIVNIH